MMDIGTESAYGVMQYGDSSKKVIIVMVINILYST